MTAPASSIPVLDSVAALAAGYDAWLCDIWGVMHNGLDAFASAADACARFREAGGTVVLISNAPRPSGPVQRQLDRIGVPAGAYDATVTSGDVTRGLLTSEPGRRVHHLGPERDRSIFDGLDIAFAAPSAADVVLCSGLDDDTVETPDDYAERLGAMRALGLPMICANPDLMVERGEALVYCAGALAAAYAELGGEVVYAGKPHLPIYEMALERAGAARGAPLDKARVLAIGDGLRTDIAGAEAAGLDALFVASGLHVKDAAKGRALDEAQLTALFPDGGTLPVAAQTRLAW